MESQGHKDEKLCEDFRRKKKEIKLDLVLSMPIYHRGRKNPRYLVKLTVSITFLRQLGDRIIVTSH